MRAGRITTKRAVATILGILGLGLGLAALGHVAVADDDRPGAAERGRIALTTRSYIEPEWSLDVREKARRFLGPDAPDPAADPDGYALAFNRHFGLHPAPYPNAGLPMGLRRAASFDGKALGVNLDCMVCHGGSIGGTSYVGLGNSQLDLEALLNELTQADGRRPPLSLFTLNSARGTNNAGQIAVVLLSLRNPDLSRRKLPLITGASVPELDTPPWWLLKKKRTKYYDGRTPAGATRSNMQFMLGDLSRDQFEALEPTFQDIDAYLMSLEPPKYPFPIDAAKAARGREVFEETCSRCHGTYGEDWTYPNRIVPLDLIGTDPARARGLTDRFIDHYNASWFAEKDPVDEVMTGYQAPPLDGIWASAPYLHNGSVPTLYNLLKSSTRPNHFRRPPSTDFEHYDTERVGWKAEEVSPPPDASLPRAEAKWIYDTSRRGLGNAGHTFGDGLGEDDRMAVLEYLKTL
jgi:cytochrome c5